MARRSRRIAPPRSRRASKRGPATFIRRKPVNCLRRTAHNSGGNRVHVTTLNVKREHLATAGYSLMVGLLATLTMDLTALVMVKTGLFRLGPYRVVPELLSRWIGSFPAGAFVHSTILETAPVPHEKLIGLASHYLIGLTLTSVLLFPHVGIRHRSISFRTGLLFGLVTCIFPWFLMF